VYIPADKPLVVAVVDTLFAATVFCPRNHSKEYVDVPVVTDAVADPLGKVASQEVMDDNAEAVIAGFVLWSTVTVTGSDSH
jgi:hypothetical protein